MGGGWGIPVGELITPPLINMRCGVIFAKVRALGPRLCVVKATYPGMLSSLFPPPRDPKTIKNQVFSRENIFFYIPPINPLLIPLRGPY